MADDAPDPRRGAADHRWQAQQAGSVDQPARGNPRRFWLVILSGLFLALASVVALWALLLNQPPPVPSYFAINIARHNDPLFTPLASSRKTVERMEVFFRDKQKQPETKDKQLLQSWLKALANKPENEPVIVHLTAQAIVRDKTVYLIPGSAQPDDETTWLDVNEVLIAMRDCGSKKKLLILDLAHDFVDCRLGVAADRVAEALEALLIQAKPTFAVLCPCSAGQYSLTAEVMQASVFSYYLEQGLQGNADADRNRLITVKELAAFVEARVDRWARDNRGLRQRPRLFFEGADFVVANVRDPAPVSDETPDPPPAKIDAYPDRLQKAWAERDLLRDKAISRAPRFLHKLEANLLRQERLWRGGANQTLDWKALDESAQNQLGNLVRSITEASAPARSLPMALKDAKDNQALVDGVMTILANTKDSSKKDDINDKVSEELLKKLQEQKTFEFPEVASIVVEALSIIPQMKPDDVRVAQKSLLTLKPRERFVEHLYLQRLIDFADKLKEKNDPETWVWHADKTQIILQTMRAHQALLAGLNREPGLLPWAAGAILEADKLRQSGERKVLRERPSAWKEGFAEMQAAKRKYDEAATAFEALRRGRRELDRAFAELPGFGRLVCDWPEFDLQAEKAWYKAAVEAKKLQAFFIAPPAVGAAISESVPSYQSPFAELDKLFKRRMLVAEKEDGAGVLQQIHCLLDLPFLKATERASLLRRQAELAAKLHEATDKLDQEDNELRRVALLPAVKRDPGEKNIGLVRARMTLEMLRLAGFESKEKLTLPADEILTPEEWTRIERALRDRCGKELTAALRGAKALPLADALNRVVSPWETEGRAELEKEPSRRLNRMQRKTFFDWLVARYEAESKVLESSPTDQPATTFYAEAARELRLRGADAD